MPKYFVAKVFVFFLRARGIFVITALASKELLKQTT
jgi:hypothetical protein